MVKGKWAVVKNEEKLFCFKEIMLRGSDSNNLASAVILSFLQVSSVLHLSVVSFCTDLLIIIIFFLILCSHEAF